MSFKKREK